MWFRWLAILISIGGLTGCAGGAAPPVALAEERVVAVAGVAFRPPADWLVEERAGIVSMSPPETSPATGPTLVLTANSLENLNIEQITPATIEAIDDWLAAFLSTLERETATIHTEPDPPETLTIGGAPGRALNFRATGFGDIEAEVTGRAALALLDDNRVFVLLGLAAAPAAWEDAETAHFNAVLQSVRFLEPVPAGPANE